VRPRLLWLSALALALVACGDVTGVGSGGATARPTAVADLAPDLPPEVLSVVERFRGASAYNTRVDRVTARRSTWAEYLAGTGTQTSTLDPAAPVWVIAATGRFYPSFGVIAMPASPCSLEALDANLNAVASRVGPLSVCAPYFTGSLVPADQPIHCDTSVTRSTYPGNPTAPAVPGPIALTIARDEAWTAPMSVPGRYVYDHGDPGWPDSIFCIERRLVTVPDAGAIDDLRALAVRIPVPQDRAQIWLKNYHVIGATAGPTGNVTVVVEPRSGFEIASYDWRALVPHGPAYVRFDFIDLRGNTVIPFEVANGP
jgi:hypothetical protein